MFELMGRDTWLFALMAVCAVFIVLPLQLLLCFQANRTMIRLLPTILLAAATIVFYILRISAQDWSALIYLILTVFAKVLLIFSGIAWGIWAIAKHIKKKNSEIQ